MAGKLSKNAEAVRAQFSEENAAEFQAAHGEDLAAANGTGEAEANSTNGTYKPVQPHLEPDGELGPTPAQREFSPLCEEFERILKERVELTNQETAARNLLKKAMRRHNVQRYQHGDVVYKFEYGEPKLVRVKAKDEKKKASTQTVVVDEPEADDEGGDE